MSFIGSRSRLARAATVGICALLLASVPAGAANAAWAFRIASTGDDAGNTIGVDAAGNTYVGGDFGGTVDFDPRSTTDLIASQGDQDGFVASYTPDDHLRWAFGIGGTSYDIVSALVVSGSSVTIVGSFSNTVDLDPGPARHRVTAHGGYTDGFVLRVRQLDGAFIWGGRVGGTGFDELRSVAEDSAGNTLLAGHFTGTADLDPSSGVHNHQAMGTIDTFVTRIGPDASFGWAVAFDGTSEQEAYSVASGPSNEVLFTGSFAGSLDLDPGSGAHVVASKGNYDAFLVTLTASGGFVRGATFGSSGIDFPAAVAADAGGNVWLAGTFAKTVDFDPGPTKHTHKANGSYDVFLVELGAAGAFVRLDTFGGTAQEEPAGMAIDGAGNVYLAGQFTSKTDFDPSSDRFFMTPFGDGDVFNLELSSIGTFRDAWSMGGAGNEGAYAIAALGQSVYTTGWFYAKGDYDPGPGRAPFTTSIPRSRPTLLSSASRTDIGRQRVIYRPPWRIELTVRGGVPRLLADAALAETIDRALRAAGAPSPAAIGLTLTDDREIAALNESAMGHEGPTDVLSFPLLQPDAFPDHTGRAAGRADAAQPKFVVPGRRTHLGDIMVSVERAIEQAELGRGGQTSDVRWAPADELRLLVTHGVLHICGWDHADSVEAPAMRALETELLEDR